MAVEDVKWSDNTEFVPQTVLGDDDELMGLTSSGLNAKYKKAAIFKNNTIATLIYVDSAGNDTAGNGSYNIPYATVSHALSTISDASATNPYVILITSDITDPNPIYVMPYVGITSLGKNLITVSSPLTLSADWSGSSGAFAFIRNLEFTDVINLDFSSAGAISPSVEIENMNGTVIAKGYASGANPLTQVVLNNFSGSVTGDSINLTTRNCNFSEYVIGQDTAVSGLIINSYNDQYNTSVAINQNCPAINSKVSIYNAAILGNSYFTATESTTKFVFSGCSFRDDTNAPVGFTLGNGVNSFIDMTLVGCTKPAFLTYDDQSVSGKRITFQTDNSSQPNDITVQTGYFNAVLLDVTHTTESSTDIDFPVVTKVGLTYEADQPAMCYYYLPVLARKGEWVEFIRGQGNFRVYCNLGQTIGFGSYATTEGVDGYIECPDASARSKIRIECIDTDSQWSITQAVGTIELV